MEAIGRTATASIEGGVLRIKRKRSHYLGRGEKAISLKQITGVEWKSPDLWSLGYIEFTLPGAREKESKFGSKVKDASKSENALIFSKKRLRDFEILRACVEQTVFRQD